jgi:hypothetical protein
MKTPAATATSGNTPGRGRASSRWAAAIDDMTRRA